MTTNPNSPRLLKGGLVLVDPVSGRQLRVISLQYNPDSLSRTLQVQTTVAEGSNRSEPMRFKGPAVETIKLEAEIDAADQLEFPDQNRDVVDYGIHPQLAVLESLAHPTTAQLRLRNEQAGQGIMEIAPMEAPLILFVWSRYRILPVRLTDFSITEEAFDPALNPLRAKVSLGLRVLSTDDLGFSHPGSNSFLGYLRNKERLAARAAPGSLAALGIGRIG
jgi:hypothetical protein